MELLWYSTLIQYFGTVISGPVPGSVVKRKQFSQFYSTQQNLQPRGQRNNKLHPKLCHSKIVLKSDWFPLGQSEWVIFLLCKDCQMSDIRRWYQI